MIIDEYLCDATDEHVRNMLCHRYSKTKLLVGIKILHQTRSNDGCP